MSNEVAVTTAAPEPQWAAFVALDWADQKHYWRLAEASSQSVWFPYWTNSQGSVTTGCGHIAC